MHDTFRNMKHPVKYRCNDRTIRSLANDSAMQSLGSFDNRNKDVYFVCLDNRNTREKKKSHIPGVTENIIIVGRVIAQTYRRLKSALSGGEIARTSSS